MGINSALSAWAGFTAGVIGTFALITRKQAQAEAAVTAELEAIFAADEADFDEDFDDVERHFTQQYNVGDPVKTTELEGWHSGEVKPPIEDATITHAQYDAGLGEWLYKIDKSDAFFAAGALEYDAARADAMLAEQEDGLLTEIDELLAELSDMMRLIDAFGNDEHIERSGKIRIELTGKATALEQTRAARTAQEVSER
ncbi:hypothetical protein [Salibacterium lacus]|uniref:Uncharacterized protein n=1 Tax=Salibacterium lacus TaxID=1898109 RepID=A0ABW5SY99_9BACI